MAAAAALKAGHLKRRAAEELRRGQLGDAAARREAWGGVGGLDNVQ